MIKQKFSSLYFLFLLFFLCAGPELFSQKNYSALVNPFIGTGGHGHTFPGAVRPFGMVQLSPDTRVDGSWDGCGGYHYSDDTIYGFSHTHLSGTGVSDWGDILLMPVLGPPTVDPKIYSSKFSHDKEKAHAGFYEVFLEDDKIKAELTVTPRVGIHRYTFEKKNEFNMVVDLLHRDKVLDCGFQFIDSVTVAGFRTSEGWAKKQQIFFVMKFSKPYKSKKIATGGKFIEKLGKFRVRLEAGVFTFDNNDGQPLIVKVALSPISVKGAIKNMESEANGWDFDNYVKEASKAWDQQLNKIEITEKDPDKQVTFYTALYHCFIHPSLNMDIDGQYRGRDEKVYTAQGFTNYSVFSLWDTYRALNPLFTILEPARVNDFINSFLAQYERSGRLPMWELSSNETDCMIGFHSVSVIADAYLKGIRKYDSRKAFEAMKAASNYSAYGTPEFNRKGYLQIDDQHESVSKTLEYAYDNWCIAQMATYLNKKDESNVFLKRSSGYKNLFDAETGFMRPRKNGNWLSPFSPSEINNHFTEGNSWQYSFYVPHDLKGLIALHGGKENFEKKLDELFSTSEKTSGREQADVTGLIGQYAHGNEPSHHMAYLYNFVGKPEKTRKLVEKIATDFYKNSPDGLIGNEDCGQMSAWYIFSSLGMYPVCPGSNEYILSAPLFERIKINLENGKSVVINSSKKNNQELNKVTLNNNELLRSAISHSALIKGGTLQYLFADTKTSQYGMGLNSPETKIDAPMLVAPVIKAKGQVFKQRLEISIDAGKDFSGEIFYTVGDSGKTTTKKYAGPFSLDSNTTIKARSVLGKDSSSESKAVFYKLKYDYDIRILSKANEQYAAEGPSTLIDGIPSDIDWRKGNWLGYQGQNFECLIDLKEQKNLKEVSFNFLQDTRSWILFPPTVKIYGSTDNVKFSAIDSVTSPIKPDDYKIQLRKYSAKIDQQVQARYLKIVAEYPGELPAWHAGKGGESFIFVDELSIR